MRTVRIAARTVRITVRTVIKLRTLNHPLPTVQAEHLSVKGTYGQMTGGRRVASVDLAPWLVAET